MANQSTKQIARLGGEEQVVTLFGNVFNALQNAQPGLNSEDITTLILNSYSGVLNQISPAKYDYILGVFTSAGLGEQIAKAYALLCIDAVKTLNISFDKLFESLSIFLLMSLLRITAAAKTGPIKLPLPTSSTPAKVFFIL